MRKTNKMSHKKEWDNPVAVNPQEPFANLSHPKYFLGPKDIGNEKIRD